MTEHLNWNLPCGHGCIVGRPKGMAPNGRCKHASDLKLLGPAAAQEILRRVLQSRADMAESLRRFQKNNEIESDYIDPFDSGITC